MVSFVSATWRIAHTWCKWQSGGEASCQLEVVKTDWTPVHREQNVHVVPQWTCSTSVDAVGISGHVSTSMGLLVSEAVPVP